MIPAINNNKQTTFTGMAIYAPARRIYNATDAIIQWQKLKHPKYTNIFQEEEYATRSDLVLNKHIHDENYSFLEELKSDKEKAKFIEYFKMRTGFPSLREASAKILEEFKRVIHLADETLKGVFRPASNSQTDNVILSGYDRFCSAGLNTSLPGSDLDKGYAILKSVNGNINRQKEYSDAFKGIIWENIDNRIMSVNHMSAFPNIMTLSELQTHLAIVDQAAKNFVKGPNDIHYFRVQRFSNPHLIPGARFNIWLSEYLNNTQKYDAKNLSYIVEAIRDGIRLEYNGDEEIMRTLDNSIFGWCSNVSAGYRMEAQYNYKDVLKPKLKARQKIEQEFDSWPIKEQYELVKDIIRSMSGDNKIPEFAPLFNSPSDKHRLLLNDILRGNVECYFDINRYREKAILKYSTEELEKKYKGLNLYNFQYDY